MIDVNVYLSRWPFRRLPHDETAKLADKLRSRGVIEAWAGTFDGLLHEDIGGANARLAAECAAVGGNLLRPFGSVNPTLPDWRDDIRRCQEEYGMPGIRLHPNYHGYDLEAPEFAELLDLAGERGLVVQIAVMMEDERTQHPLLQVPAVETKPLLELLPSRKGLKVVLLNSQRAIRGEAMTRLAEAGEVSFEIAMQEGVGGVSKLLKLLPFERVLFGSYFPFFYFESAEFKLQESELGESIGDAIRVGNARRLLGEAAG